MYVSVETEKKPCKCIYYWRNVLKSLQRLKQIIVKLLSVRMEWRVRMVCFWYGGIAQWHVITLIQNSLNQIYTDWDKIANINTRILIEKVGNNDIDSLWNETCFIVAIANSFQRKLRIKSDDFQLLTGSTHQHVEQNHRVTKLFTWPIKFHVLSY